MILYLSLFGCTALGQLGPAGAAVGIKVGAFAKTNSAVAEAVAISIVVERGRVEHAPVIPDSY